MNTSGLITVKQLPIIEQALEELSKQIDERVSVAKSLVAVNDDKVLSNSKKIRAELNKEFTELETARKNVKNEVMQPYIEFESIYKEKISDKYKEADVFFKSQITDIENGIKQERTDELQAYFDEYCIAENITGVKLEDLKIKVNLSGSMKSYRDKVKEALDDIKKDFEVIDTIQDEKERCEITVDYLKDFDIKRAVLEHEKKKREIAELMQKSVEAKEDEIQAPITEEDTKQYTMSFTVTGTKQQLKDLKQYLLQNKLI